MNETVTAWLKYGGGKKETSKLNFIMITEQWNGEMLEVKNKVINIVQTNERLARKVVEGNICDNFWS